MFIYLKRPYIISEQIVEKDNLPYGMRTINKKNENYKKLTKFGN